MDRPYVVPIDQCKPDIERQCSEALNNNHGLRQQRMRTASSNDMMGEKGLRQYDRRKHKARRDLIYDDEVLVLQGRQMTPFAR